MSLFHPLPLSAALGAFPVLPCQFELEAIDQLPLGEFSGSSFRGLMGHVLKSVACREKRYCEACRSPHSCAYAYLFDTVNRGSEEVPRPFVLRPPRGGRVLRRGEPFSLGITLLGEGTGFLSYFVSAVEEMGRVGLGQVQARFRVKQALLVDATGRETPFYQGQQGALPGRMLSDPGPWQLASLAERGERLSGASRVELEFRSPTRLVHQGRALSRPPFHVLMRALLRRLDMLTTLHGAGQLRVDFRDLIALAGEVQLESEMLRWCEFERYSNRQGKAGRLAGVQGRVVYSGPVGAFMPYLLCAPTVHLGKATTFGLGQVALTLFP